MLMATIYTRPGNGSDPVYDGFAGGSAHNHRPHALSAKGRGEIHHV